MGRYPKNRMVASLSSGLSILMLASVFVVYGEMSSAIAEDSLSQATVTEPKEKSETSKSSTEVVPSGNLSTDKKTEVTGPTIAIPQATGKTPAVSEPGEHYEFHATAYCLKGRTASGAYVERGMIAADPRVLPLGTIVHIQAGKYTGTYKVTDTGGAIRGKKIDIYVPSYQEAIRFGRQKIKVKVLSHPKRSSSSSNTTKR